LYTDERLTCIDCGTEFVFTVGEQQFFATKGFQNKPNRCPDCRTARKNARQGGGGNGGGRGDYSGGGSAREMFSVTCSSCGQAAEVPFQPRGDKPVYCRDCFQSQRSQR
jgi:CxxC-x17-CxxC domain-containing protein